MKPYFMVFPYITFWVLYQKWKQASCLPFFTRVFLIHKYMYIYMSIELDPAFVCFVALRPKSTA